MHTPKSATALAALALLISCGSGVAPQEDAFRELLFTGSDAPPWAPPDTCWGRNLTPAVVETVTEQIVVRPAEIGADGTVLQPASYRTETRQDIVRERREDWFESPCAARQDPEFIASLQRALAAREIYDGPVTGQMDRRTQEAVRRYQATNGLNSGILSMDAARNLGLVALEREKSGE